MAVDALFWHHYAGEQIEGKQGHFLPLQIICCSGTETVFTPKLQKVICYLKTYSHKSCLLWMLHVVA